MLGCDDITPPPGTPQAGNGSNDLLNYKIFKIQVQHYFTSRLKILCKHAKNPWCLGLGNKGLGLALSRKQFWITLS